ncbi:hypothetical protein E2C01_066918 [Portunus trituberculatus]|uniref:Uncharacterized protein n=1 Tax=Portunus trituberculatus TaxID=210409 RepID=A0A5B7HS17_PORTR|nr:hypothetical protein [Portunus trituberculatus]
MNSIQRGAGNLRNVSDADYNSSRILALRKHSPRYAHQPPVSLNEGYRHLKHTGNYEPFGL